MAGVVGVGPQNFGVGQKIGSGKTFGMADVGGNFHVSALGKLQAPENTQEITCARVWHRCFPVNFEKFLRPLF